MGQRKDVDWSLLRFIAKYFAELSGHDLGSLLSGLFCGNLSSGWCVSVSLCEHLIIVMLGASVIP